MPTEIGTFVGEANLFCLSHGNSCLVLIWEMKHCSQMGLVPQSWFSHRSSSYLQNIGMDLLNTCLCNTFYDIYILWEFRRLEEKTKTPAYSLNLSSSHSGSFSDLGVFCSIDL